LQFWNKYPASDAFVKSKFEISTYSKLMQSVNRKFMFSTELVLKFDKSKEINEKHSLNIESIDLTEDELKVDKSKEVSSLQP
jgi:hypothetical protein